MSNFEKKAKKLLLSPSKTIPQKQSLKTTKNPNQSLNPSINSFILQAKKINANTWLNLQKI